MALKIKKGAVIDAYGPNTNPFTDASELSQEILEHLQTRFPKDIEGTYDGAVVKSLKDETPPTPYDGKTVAELKELAKDLEGYENKMTKQALLDLLTAADAKAAADAETKDEDFV